MEVLSNRPGLLYVKTDIERANEGIAEKDTKTEADGTCINENSKKLVELWKKHPTCVMLWCKMDLKGKQTEERQARLGRYMNHFVIYSPKNRKIIDVSNGWMKIVDKDYYFEINNIVKNKTLTKKDIDFSMEMAYDYKAEQMVAFWCNCCLAPPKDFFWPSKRVPCE